MAGEDDKPEATGEGEQEPSEARPPRDAHAEGSAEETEARPSDAPPAAPPAEASPAAAPAAAAPARLAWGAPIDRFDRAWTRVEAVLCAGVLGAMVLTLVGWIALKALSSTGRDGAGELFRSMLTATLFGLVVHFATRRQKELVHHTAGTAAVIAGWIAGKFWGDAGVTYFANLLAWMQNASFLVFFGGVSELAKRLTLWVALLGASIATAQGKHINVDVVMRFLSPRARVPVAVLGWLTAALVSGAAAWGFFDDVAVEEFHAPATVPCEVDGQTKSCPAPPTSKVERVVDDTSRNLFLAGRQISLDLRSIPKVLTGTHYSEWLTPQEWNAWLRGADWASRFPAEDVKALELPEDGSIEYRTPAVTSVPGGTERIHMLLVPLMNMVFPFGLLIIAIRFVLRSLLAISGWVQVDPDAAHSDDPALAHAHDPTAPTAEAAR